MLDPRDVELPPVGDVILQDTETGRTREFTIDAQLRDDFAKAAAAHRAEVARTLPNSLNVVVPFGGHSLAGLEGIECIHRLQRETIERGSVAGLDTSCVAGIRRRGFPTTLP